MISTIFSVIRCQISDHMYTYVVHIYIYHRQGIYSSFSLSIFKILVYLTIYKSYIIVHKKIAIQYTIEFIFRISKLVRSKNCSYCSLKYWILGDNCIYTVNMWILIILMYYYWYITYYQFYSFDIPDM